MLRLALLLLLHQVHLSHAKTSENEVYYVDLRASPEERYLNWKRDCAQQQTLFRAARKASLALSNEESKFLKYLCLHPKQIVSSDTSDSSSKDLRSYSNFSVVNDNYHDGIPPGVSCTPTQWCDSGYCSTVCSRGSVRIDKWLDNALRTQAQLARSLPFCYSTWFGTHNSAISLSDGYGNLDPAYQSLFKYIRWASADFHHAILRTNNQYLSITDQMNLGVRALELDTHWVGGILRIAHCGGLHIGPFNFVVKMINTLAKLVGHHIRWDTETMGCVPSLSSIPAMVQRTLVDALMEVKAWMDEKKNEEEFLILYFDDQPDLLTWGVAENLKEDILKIFPLEWIFTQTDLATFAMNTPLDQSASWPSARDMHRRLGRRLLLVSASDYGLAMDPVIFPRGQTICGWMEPPLSSFHGSPQCDISSSLSSSSSSVYTGLHAENHMRHRRHRRQSSTTHKTDYEKNKDLFIDGDIIRVTTCELEYGPMNCDFIWNGGLNIPSLNEDTLPGVTTCGLNIPSPDLLTPSRAAAAVWTWARGHPFSYHSEEEEEEDDDDALHNSSSNNHCSDHVRCNGGSNRGVVASIRQSAIVSANDSMWRVAVSCAEDGDVTKKEMKFPIACRYSNATVHSRSPWMLGSGSCPDGTVFDVPRHPRENQWLAEMARRNGFEGVMLPVWGPEWRVEDGKSVDDLK